MPFCAPSAIRTRDLLLRSNPAVDAVAISDDAGHVSGGTHCCSPSYLVIASRDTGRAIASQDTVRIVPARGVAQPPCHPPVTPGAARFTSPGTGATHFFRVLARPALYTAGMSSDVPTEKQTAEREPARALPEHLSA